VLRYVGATNGRGEADAVRDGSPGGPPGGGMARLAKVALITQTQTQ
jgi:hypothetical protein